MLSILKKFTVPNCSTTINSFVGLNLKNSIQWSRSLHIDTKILNKTVEKVKTDLKVEKENKVIVNPFKHEDFFEVKKLINLEELFKSRCHYGHDAGLRCPWMSEFIFGTRIRTDIIDLDKTAAYMEKALNFIAHIAFRNGVILFVSRYPQHIPLIERTAFEVGEYSHCKPWKEGLFTDSTRKYGSVVRLPDLCILFHANDKLNETHKIVFEAAKMLIPTVAICDTDIDPSEITYPIPGNDDSMASQQLYCRLIKQTILNAKNKRKQLEEQGAIISYE